MFAARLCFVLLEDVIQPVEHDLVLKALVIGSAVSLAALLRGDDVLRFGTGQLVVEFLTVYSQLALTLSTNIKIRAGDLVLQTPQAEFTKYVDEFCDRSAARPFDNECLPGRRETCVPQTTDQVCAKDPWGKVYPPATRAFPG